LYPTEEGKTTDKQKRCRGREMKKKGETPAVWTCACVYTHSSSIISIYNQEKTGSERGAGHKKYKKSIPELEKQNKKKTKKTETPHNPTHTPQKKQTKNTSSIRGPSQQHQSHPKTQKKTIKYQQDKR
jgi:hypothetical protein